MSSGRVQGPTLKIIVDREKEIKAFIPVPFWQIQLLGEYKKVPIEAFHKEDKFWEKEKAEKAFQNTKGKKAIVDNVKREKFDQKPPAPFDLTTLQTEAYRNFRIQPKKTLEIAQSLYLAGLISYPRTSSQQYPDAIDFKKILKLISKQSKYKDLCNQLLKNPLKPNNGKKRDPAHPAIYPTGEIGRMSEQELKIYDLIT